MVVFEDDKDSPVSLLLSYGLKGDVEFCGGNGQVRKNFKKWYRVNELNIVCMDFSPDNTHTTRALYNTYKDLKTYNNVIVLPIPCIEYYVLQLDYMLNFIQDEDISMVLDRGYYWGSYGTNSFEIYCKHVLNDNDKECIRNIKKFGSFYKVPCVIKDCGDCSLGYGVSLDLKCTSLISKLPVITHYHNKLESYPVDLSTVINTSYEDTIRWVDDYFKHERICKSQALETTKKLRLMSEEQVSRFL